MEKYLFTDGTNVVREVQSKEELHTLIQSSGDPGKIRIWIFSTSEWITCTEFSKRSVAKAIPLKKTALKEEKKQESVVAARKPQRKHTGALKFFIAVLTGAAIFLVYNFTRVKWHTASSLQITAARPENSPLVNVDSLIQIIEATRGQKLDKVTLTNLRIRNTWPDRIELKLKTDRDTGQAGTKFYNVDISIDNSTGYNIDNAIVELKEWKNDALNTVDTLHFNNIGYSALSGRKLDAEYRGDSLSVSFLSVKARSFNFCYSYDKESNYGNFNDRWFCRE
ncbi:MAG TPA: hypothetical protein VJ111_16905 [Chitinophagaceae bacterium]|nr:hypothetical protein [Chitinophagaceae bacterium]